MDLYIYIYNFCLRESRMEFIWATQLFNCEGGNTVVLERQLFNCEGGSYSIRAIGWIYIYIYIYTYKFFLRESRVEFMNLYERERESIKGVDFLFSLFFNWYNSQVGLWRSWILLLTSCKPTSNWTWFWSPHKLITNF